MDSIFKLACAVVLLAIGFPSQAAEKKQVLVVTVTKGFRHSSIPTAEKVLGQLASSSGLFTVDYARTDEDVASAMSPESLKKYDAVIFANTTGELPIADKQAFIDWVRAGHGFVGMHSASDTFHQFRPYIEMLGGEFKSHGAQAKVECIVQDHDHPATAHFGDSFTVYDEIYILKSFQRDQVHGLLTLDKEPNKGYPGDFPIAWCKEVGDGRVFYTSLGHREDVWESEPYQKHILGGIKWALGLVEGDATPQGTRFEVSQEEQRDGFKPLFNGVNLEGWALRNPEGIKSWSAQNGMLVNTVADGHGTDLLTERKFKDFVLRYDFMVPEGSNSGVYLRGIYEIQVLDDHGKEPQKGGNGAIYSIKPASKNVSRPAGEWQSAEARIKGNRITVVLNGEKIHDEVEVNRATGGELSGIGLNDAGPIMLQGDHGAVAFRNMRIKELK